MRILMVSPYDFAVPGGVNNHITAVSREMRRAGHTVRILAPSSAHDSSRTDQPDPDDVIRVSGNILTVLFAGSRAGISLSPLIYGRVKRLLLQEEFDVLHLHEPLAPALPLVVLRHSTLVPRSARIATFHAYRRRPLPGTGNTLFRAYLKKLDGLIAVSSSAKAYHRAYFPGEYRVIPNGVNVQVFGSAAPIAELKDRPNVLFVGRLDDRKGFTHLLEAFGGVRRRVPEVRLLVVGAFDEDDREPFERRTEELGLAEHVLYVGPVSAPLLPRYYRTADVFCSPATGFESFGLVLLEAMAAGCPVVASDIPGYRTVLSHNVEGLAVPPGDHVALEDSLVALLSNAALRARMSEAARATSARYSWERITRQILEFYSATHLHARREHERATTVDPTLEPRRRILSHRPSPPMS